MSQGTHEFVDDPRNRDIRIYVNGELKPRAEAVVSVFDSGFILGDGVWEGLRVHAGRIAFLDQHLDRLYDGAKAVDMDIGLTPADFARTLDRTLHANGSTDPPLPAIYMVWACGVSAVATSASQVLPR